MYPGVPKNARIALEDDVLPPVPEMGIHEGVRIQKGDYVVWMDTLLMKNPKVSQDKFTLLNFRLESKG